MSEKPDESQRAADAAPRQWVERVPGARRRARLTPVAGTDTSPEPPITRDDPILDARPAADGGAPASGTPTASGPNDERLRRDVPPHW
ncbi:hypothetical protein ASC66_07330 [Leifsonia sp. Root4]|uniref:hypothetical protein n=1 Tax=Leifsonia sp. Root4 TaxID=1736525 RepID=UPI0006FC317D|nr:hypothetical protein [Leifsonia sp. Root4]KQW06745.1 hypothetical protein ASC66_07330 [Leifsonia sp. Root4]